MCVHILKGAFTLELFNKVLGTQSWLLHDSYVIRHPRAFTVPRMVTIQFIEWSPSHFFLTQDQSIGQASMNIVDKVEELNIYCIRRVPQKENTHSFLEL